MGRVLFWVTRVCLFTQLIEVDRLGSGIRVSARFQIFALTAGWGGGGNCRDGGTDRGNTFRGNVLPSYACLKLFWGVNFWSTV